MRTFHPLRRRRGFSLVEMTVATMILTGVLALTFPAMNSISDAGHTGRTQSWCQSDNRQALLRISRELMNGSLTARDTLGNPRMELLAGSARQTLTGNYGVTATTHGTSTTSSGGSIGDSSNYYTGTSGEGSGARGGTTSGRQRSSSMVASTYDSGASRPREKLFTDNSVLRFQKILSYAWGADGEPVINWGPWIEFRVQGRSLVRVQGTQELVISSNCSGFMVEQTTANTLLLTIVTERRGANAKDIARQANSIEVVPKN